MSDINAPEAARQAMRHLQQGIAAASAGRVDEAIAAFRHAVAEHPGLAAAQANLGLLLVAAGRHAEAEAPLAAALAGMPGDAVLRHALGVVLESTGRPADAEREYRAAIAARPSLADAHAGLGNSLRRLGRLEEARASLERAIELQPGFSSAHVWLGHVLKELGRLDAAADEYRRALALEPAHVEAMHNLGGCLRRLGQVDEARAVFERVLALRPDQLETHCNLAVLKTYAPGDPQVAQLLAQQARVPALPVLGQVRYWFTAGKMLEDTGRHDEAFAAYERGNRLRFGLTPWDEKVQEDALRRTAATFTREVVARRVADASDDGPVPVFIVGMPRSGTTLLEQVLATLPSVHAAGEISDFADVLESAAHDHPPGEFRFPETLGGYSAEQFLRLGRRYLDRLRALAPRATHVVDKLPVNFMHVGAIHAMLPHARIVHAMRDPMDSCFSCYSRLFENDSLAYTYDLEVLGRYWVGYDDLMRHWRAVLPEGAMLEMPYETVVADFERQARRLVDYLGLPWDERCLAFHDNRRVVKTASVAQVRRPLYGSSVARWKAFERHLGPLHEIVRDRR